MTRCRLFWSQARRNSSSSLVSKQSWIAQTLSKMKSRLKLMNNWRPKSSRGWSESIEEAWSTNKGWWSRSRRKERLRSRWRIGFQSWCKIKLKRSKGSRKKLWNIIMRQMQWDQRRSRQRRSQAALRFSDMPMHASITPPSAKTEQLNQGAQAEDEIKHGNSKTSRHRQWLILTCRTPWPTPIWEGSVGRHHLRSQHISTLKVRFQNINGQNLKPTMALLRQRHPKWARAGACFPTKWIKRRIQKQASTTISLKADQPTSEACATLMAKPSGTTTSSLSRPKGLPRRARSTTAYIRHSLINESSTSIQTPSRAKEWLRVGASSPRCSSMHGSSAGLGHCNRRCQPPSRMRRCGTDTCCCPTRKAPSRTRCHQGSAETTGSVNWTTTAMALKRWASIEDLSNETELYQLIFF